MIDKDTRTGPLRKYVMWSLNPVLCTLYSVSVLYFLPSRGQGRDNSICSANEYRGQGRDNTEDKIGAFYRLEYVINLLRCMESVRLHCCALSSCPFSFSSVFLCCFHKKTYLCKTNPQAGGGGLPPLELKSYL